MSELLDDKDNIDLGEDFVDILRARSEPPTVFEQAMKLQKQYKRTKHSDAPAAEAAPAEFVNSNSVDIPVDVDSEIDSLLSTFKGLIHIAHVEHLTINIQK